MTLKSIVASMIKKEDCSLFQDNLIIKFTFIFEFISDEVRLNQLKRTKIFVF